ncbi:MAG: hypothetical protein ACRD21_21175 [Vicinamibacteria bacterium]
MTPVATGAAEHRRILGEYSLYLLYTMIAVVTASTVVSAAPYAMAPETASIFGTEPLVWTLLSNDRPILVAVALWAATTVTSIHPGRESG